MSRTNTSTAGFVAQLTEDYVLATARSERDARLDDIRREEADLRAAFRAQRRDLEALWGAQLRVQNDAVGVRRYYLDGARIGFAEVREIVEARRATIQRLQDELAEALDGVRADRRSVATAYRRTVTNVRR